MDWPENYGFKEPILEVTLQCDKILSRYGERSGKFVADYETPFWQRSLPPAYAFKRFEVYRVVREIPGVLQGVTAAHHGVLGCGVQYRLPKTVDYLIEYGYLKPV